MSRTVSINDKVEVHDVRSSRTSKKANDDWKLPPRYQLKQILGSGAYGCVAEAKDSEKGRKVAIKRAKHLMDDLIDAKRILREVAILRKLNHPHIVACYDVVVPADLRSFNEIYVVLEIADSDLKKLLRSHVNLQFEHVHTLLYNLLVGLNYMHSAGVWHRDLKPANCLVNEDCSVKICDFGLARAVGGDTQDIETADSAEKRHLTGHVVTRWYRAPELILLVGNYTEAIDVWSVGCIFVELMGMLEGQRYEDRAPLFPGHSCFPLSPHQGKRNDTRFYTKGSTDTLSMIWKLIGTPSEEDRQLLTQDDAKAYVSCFDKKRGAGVIETFGGIDPEGSKLLEKMLVFNWFRRISVPEALEDPIFRNMRCPAAEKVAKAKICLDFEREQELDERDLRALFLREIKRYHPEMPDL